jgi:hypothetical protein
VLRGRTGGGAPKAEPPLCFAMTYGSNRELERVLEGGAGTPEKNTYIMYAKASRSGLVRRPELRLLYRSLFPWGNVRGKNGEINRTAGRAPH